MEITLIILVCIESFLLVIVFLVFANGRRVRKAIKELEDSVDVSGVLIYEPGDLKRLPEPVQKYFKHVLKDGQRYINIARISQSGSIRIKENQKWMQLKAVQYFDAQNPAFIWVASARSSLFYWISAVDKYFDSRASMIIRLFSLIPIIKATGKEMDSSSLIRYITEMPLFPTALLPSDNLSWEPLDGRSATAIFNNGKIKIRVNFYFNNTGEIIRVTSEGRYRYSEGKCYKDKWTGYFKNYKEINNITIPTEIEAEWNLKNGDLKYFKASIDRIDYS